MTTTNCPLCGPMFIGQCTHRMTTTPKAEVMTSDEVAEMSADAECSGQRLADLCDSHEQLRKERDEWEEVATASNVLVKTLEAEVAELQCERDALRAALEAVVSRIEEWHVTTTIVGDRFKEVLRVAKAALRGGEGEG